MYNQIGFLVFAVQIPARIFKNDAGYKNHDSVIFLL